MLTEVQLLIVATLGSVIVWLLKLTKANVASSWLTVGVYGVSLVLAWIFSPLAIPARPICAEVSTCVTLYVSWLGELLILLSAFAGFATLIYNALLKAVLDKYVKPLIKKAS